MFERLELLIGKENLNKIKTKHILVIGLGGVGRYVVESLIRSGIENITIVDFDKIDISNLNRQLMTNLNNIGKLKTDEIEKRILMINKNVYIKKISKFINEDNYLELFKENIDYLIDAEDSTNTKKLIIKECLKRKIKFITCCGTGNKLDPSKLEIIDIRKTSYDPLAKSLRTWVNKEKIKVKKPSLYKVIMHNDDFTTMEFVVEVLRKVFKPADGNIFIDADYSQIELRVLAHISKDRNMVMGAIKRLGLLKGEHPLSNFVREKFPIYWEEALHTL